MFPEDECLRCGHRYDEHRHGIIAPCVICGPSACHDFVDEQQVPYMGV